MQLECWRITGSGFHFGRHGLGQEVTAETMPSDSLFAALVARYAVLYGGKAVEEWLESHKTREPPFVLTSTFPLAGDVRFFPVLMQPSLPSKGSKTQDYKKLKKVEYVSEALFREILKGASLVELFDTPVLCLHSGAVLITEDERNALPREIQVKECKKPDESESEDEPRPDPREKLCRDEKGIWSTERRPRVTLGRAAQNSNIFHTGRVTYSSGCGLWFGIRWLVEDSKLQNVVESLLLELRDAGLGGERNVGFGNCEITRDDTPLELPDAEDKPWVSLSRYLPHEKDIKALQDKRASYKLERVGGWVTSPASMAYRRRPVNLLATGAVLGPLEYTVPGQMVDVQPKYNANDEVGPLGHSVWRNGMAVAVGIGGAK